MVNSLGERELNVVFVCMGDCISVVLVGRDLFTSKHFFFECLFPAAMTWRLHVSPKIKTLGCLCALTL